MARGELLSLAQKYPQQPPPLTLSHPVFLSAGHVQTLSKLLVETAKSKLGDMMIYEVSYYRRIYDAHRVVARRHCHGLDNGQSPPIAEAWRCAESYGGAGKEGRD